MKIRRGDILYVDLGVQYQGSMHYMMMGKLLISIKR